MNKSLILAIASAVVSGFGSISALAADLDQNLVAKWTFKGGSLDSQVGGFSFIEGGKKGTVEPEDGFVAVRGRKFLICPDISATKFPGLAQNVTIWARLKFEQLPPENVANILGLQVESGNGSWKAISLALLFRGVEPEIAEPGLTVLARLSPGTEIGVGARRFLPVTVGEFMDVAIVYDGSAGTVSVWANGTQVVSKGAPDIALEAFQALGIGQLMAPGTDVAITYDEVRVYSTVLDEQWLGEITATKD